MDAQRFGRALGLGTRAAAKALLQAADAAAAPNPRPLPLRSPPASRLPNPVAFKRGAKAFGGSVLAPAVRAGSVLWLEVTGAFFGLFAVTAGVELWRLRAALHQSGEVRRNALFALGMFLAFTWFTGSNFVKAHRRARR